jgi:hypothetical protein
MLTGVRELGTCLKALALMGKPDSEGGGMEMKKKKKRSSQLDK